MAAGPNPPSGDSPSQDGARSSHTTGSRLTVVLTRPAGQSDALAKALHNAGIGRSSFR